MDDSRSKPGKPTLRQRAAEAGSAIREPRTLPAYLARGLVRIWRSRGGSWYGIGYLCTFVYLEVMMMVEDLAEAPDIVTFATSQFFESLFRWFTESLGNMIQAFLWPLSLIGAVGLWWGALLLVAIHVSFEYLVRPVAEAQFPELQEDRLAKAAKRKGEAEEQALSDSKTE